MIVAPAISYLRNGPIVVIVAVRIERVFHWTSVILRGRTGVRNPFLACRAPVAPLLWPPVMHWDVVSPRFGHESIRDQTWD